LIVFRPTVIELAGLPGTGKTTVANAIAELDGRFIAHTVRNRNLRDEVASVPVNYASLPSERRDFVMRLVTWVVTPMTVLRFRSFLIHFIWLLISTRASSLFRTSSVIGEVTDRVPSFRMIMSRLNWVLARRLQVRLRAYISKKSILVEQGYIQEAISIRLRLPKRWRDQLWNRYIHGIPKDCVCVVLKISARDAIDRISRREIDQPSLRFVKWAFNSWNIGSGHEELYEALAEVSESLEDPTIQSRFKFVYIRADDSPSNVLNDVYKVARRLSQSS